MPRKGKGKLAPQCPPPRFDPRLVLIIATVDVSFAAIFIRFSDAPSLIIALYRMVLSTLFLLPLLFMEGGFKAYTKLSRRNKLELLAAGFALAIHFGFWIESLKHVSVANAVILVTSHPLLIGVLSIYLLGERMAPVQWAGTGIAFAGIIVIAAGDWQAGAGEAFVGDMLALVGMVAFAVYLLVGRRLRQVCTTAAYVVPVYGVSAIVFFIAILVSNVPLTGYPVSDWSVFLALALVCTLGGHTLYNYTLGHVPAYLVSITLLGEPVLSTVFAWAILSEVPSWFVMPGGTMVLIGIYLATAGQMTGPRRK